MKTMNKNNEYQFESLNPGLGIQRGIFNIGRNLIYSKFTIEKTIEAKLYMEKRNNLKQSAHFYIIIHLHFPLG